MRSSYPYNENFITGKVAYHQTSNISRSLVDNEIVDHSDVVGDLPAGAAPIASIFILDWTPRFNIMHKDNRKTRQETVEFWFDGPYIRDLMV